MEAELLLLFRHWPNFMGLTFREITADPMCNFVRGVCGRWGAEKRLHLDRLAASGIVTDGHLLTSAGDWYEWVKL